MWIGESGTETTTRSKSDAPVSLGELARVNLEHVVVSLAQQDARAKNWVLVALVRPNSLDLQRRRTGRDVEDEASNRDSDQDSRSTDQRAHLAELGNEQEAAVHVVREDHVRGHSVHELRRKERVGREGEKRKRIVAEPREREGRRAVNANLGTGK